MNILQVSNLDIASFTSTYPARTYTLPQFCATFNRPAPATRRCLHVFNYETGALEAYDPETGHDLTSKDLRTEVDRWTSILSGDSDDTTKGDIECGRGELASRSAAKASFASPDGICDGSEGDLQVYGKSLSSRARVDALRERAHPSRGVVLSNDSESHAHASRSDDATPATKSALLRSLGFASRYGQGATSRHARLPHVRPTVRSDRRSAPKRTSRILS